MLKVEIHLTFRHSHASLRSVKSARAVITYPSIVAKNERVNNDIKMLWDGNKSNDAGDERLITFRTTQRKFLRFVLVNEISWRFCDFINFEGGKKAATRTENEWNLYHKSSVISAQYEVSPECCWLCIVLAMARISATIHHHFELQV